MLLQGDSIGITQCDEYIVFFLDGLLKLQRPNSMFKRLHYRLEYSLRLFIIEEYVYSYEFIIITRKIYSNSHLLEDDQKLCPWIFIRQLSTCVFYKSNYCVMGICLFLFCMHSLRQLPLKYSISLSLIFIHVVPSTALKTVHTKILDRYIRQLRNNRMRVTYYSYVLKSNLSFPLFKSWPMTFSL